jgi:hypothetical protein
MVMAVVSQKLSAAPIRGRETAFKPHADTFPVTLLFSLFIFLEALPD